MKKLWRFVYSEIRCGRTLTMVDRDMLYYARYADMLKHRNIEVRSPELKYKIEENKNRLFIKNLFRE